MMNEQAIIIWNDFMRAVAIVECVENDVLNELIRKTDKYPEDFDTPTWKFVQDFKDFLVNLKEPECSPKGFAEKLLGIMTSHTGADGNLGRERIQESTAKAMAKAEGVCLYEAMKIGKFTSSNGFVVTRAELEREEEEYQAAAERYRLKLEREEE
tara:strand:+ start:522 stop:986 length:465 start_codon:yes stop_codon:yes gene_type:complete